MSESEILVQDAAGIRNNYTFAAEIIAGRVKTRNPMLACLRAGTDIVIICPEPFFQMFQHPLTDAGPAQFADDWQKVPQQTSSRRWWLLTTSQRELA